LVNLDVFATRDDGEFLLAAGRGIGLTAESASKQENNKDF
jgi:hypothetical protein